MGFRNDRKAGGALLHETRLAIEWNQSNVDGTSATRV
jgi:hypothetical protein